MLLGSKQCKFDVNMSGRLFVIDVDHMGRQAKCIVDTLTFEVHDQLLAPVSMQ